MESIKKRKRQFQKLIAGCEENDLLLFYEYKDSENIPGYKRNHLIGRGAVLKGMKPLRMEIVDFRDFIWNPMKMDRKEPILSLLVEQVINLFFFCDWKKITVKKYSQTQIENSPLAAMKAKDNNGTQGKLPVADMTLFKSVIEELFGECIKRVDIKTEDMDVNYTVEIETGVSFEKLFARKKINHIDWSIQEHKQDTKFVNKKKPRKGIPPAPGMLWNDTIGEYVQFDPLSENLQSELIKASSPPQIDNIVNHPGVDLVDTDDK